jgi:large subunit GTPase 1
LLLVNKADLLTSSQRCVLFILDVIQLPTQLDRREWADYFDKNNIRFAFFSAANAAAIQQARRDAIEKAQLLEGAGASAEEQDDEAPTPPLSDDTESESEGEAEESDDSEDHHLPLHDESEEEQDPRARVLSVLELEGLFMKMAPPLTGRISSRSSGSGC